MTTSGEHFILFISVIFLVRFIIFTVKSEYDTQVRVGSSFQRRVAQQRFHSPHSGAHGTPAPQGGRAMPDPPCHRPGALHGVVNWLEFKATLRSF